MVSQLKVNEIVKQSGSSITIGGDGDNVNLASGSKAKLMNPSFLAYIDGTNTISDDTWTKVTFAAELFDSDSAYDSSTNYRFQPQLEGYYQISSTVTGNASGVGKLRELYTQLYKNGSGYAMLSEENLNSGFDEYRRTSNGSFIVHLNGSTDYVEVYTYINSTDGSPQYTGSSVKGTHFMAYRIGS